MDEPNKRTDSVKGDNSNNTGDMWKEEVTDANWREAPNTEFRGEV
jgi:hypothetical protein